MMYLDFLAERIRRHIQINIKKAARKIAANTAKASRIIFSTVGAGRLTCVSDPAIFLGCEAIQLSRMKCIIVTGREQHLVNFKRAK